MQNKDNKQLNTKGINGTWKKTVDIFEKGSMKIQNLEIKKKYYSFKRFFFFKCLDLIQIQNTNLGCFLIEGLLGESSHVS